MVEVVAVEDTTKILPEPVRGGKRCGRCRRDLAKSEFTSDISRVDGLSKRCKDCERTRKKALYSKNREAEVRRSVAYRKAHPLDPIAAQVYDRNHKAKRQGASGVLQLVEWKALLAAYKGRCAYCCNLPPGGATLSIDHVIPISKGGPNTRRNVVPACQGCNSYKKDRLVKPYSAEEAVRIGEDREAVQREYRAANPEIARWL